LGQFVADIVALICLSACATAPLDRGSMQPRLADLPPPAVATYREMPAAGLSCVPYARQRTGAQLRGDAYSWWDSAAGLYPRSSLPLSGSILVLQQTARLRSGHVAVVAQVIGPRQILVDHANWVPDEVITNMPVVDVSPNNDWSQLRFWNQPAGSFGAIYPAAGFIYAGMRNPDPQVTAVPAPGSSPGQDRTVVISSDGVSVGNP
jgi:surface antigen